MGRDPKVGGDPKIGGGVLKRWGTLKCGGGPNEVEDPKGG